MLSPTRPSSSIDLDRSKSVPTKTMLEQGQSSGSLGSLAIDRSKEVQLTRFKPLQAESSYDSLVTRCTTLSGNANTNANNIAQKPTDKRDKLTNKLWSIAQHGRHVSGAESDCNAPSERSDACEPFKLVWTNLSFEVELSAYDKLVNRTFRALSRVRSFRDDKAKRAQRNIVFKQTGCLEKTLHSLEKQANVDQVELVMERQLADKRNIFSNLNGYINSGELTAILGPSGAGKTSLLNAICGRTRNYAGRIRLTGAANRRRMRLSIIPQKDFLIENLTVRENLLYSSRLLNPEAQFDHRANIARVVRMLNLGACLESPAANVSGGEYKRVSIGQELLRQPDILVLDEPTSGLDSLNCRNLVGSLVQLARASRDGLMRPIAIVMTIHQPDVEVFHMFDHVYCMARAGRVIYDGHPHEAMRVIEAQLRANTGNQVASQESLPIDSSAHQIQSNPANLLIEIASGLLYGQAPIRQLADYHLNQFHGLETSLLTSTREDTERGQVASLIRDRRLHPAHTDHQSGFFWYHTRVLASRAFLSTIRDRLLMVSSLVFYVCMPIGLWLVYTRDLGQVNGCPLIERQFDLIAMASNRTQMKIRELQAELATTLECSMMFFLVTYAYTMCSLSVAALAFPLNMHILLKEVRNGWYKLPAFVLAKTLASTPLEVILPVLSLAFAYLLLGMPSSYLQWRLWAMALVMGLVSMIGSTQGLIFGALCMDSAQTAIFLGSCVSLPQVVTSGFLARIEFMPWLLQKLSWLSTFRYSSALILMIRYGFNMCPCDDSTEQYLRTSEPHFRGLAENLKPALIYYLESGIDYEEPNTNLTHITGVSSVALDVTPAERSKFFQDIEDNKLDLFKLIARLASRSLAFGNDLESCKSVRPQHLNTFNIPPDGHLLFMFTCLVALLLAFKAALSITVHYKVKSRM